MRLGGFLALDRLGRAGPRLRAFGWWTRFRARRAIRGVAKHVIALLERRIRCEQTQRERRADWQQEVVNVAHAERAVEPETDVAVTAVARHETKGLKHQPRKNAVAYGKQCEADFRSDLLHCVVNDHAQPDDQIAFQNGSRVAVILEGMPVQQRVRVEVPPRSDLRPRRVNPERDHRQKNVDDPDAKILARVAREMQSVRSSARGRDLE